MDKAGLGVPIVVAIDYFHGDTDAEIESCKALGKGVLGGKQFSQILV